MTREKKTGYDLEVQEPGETQNPVGTSKRILLVDDDAILRDVLSRILIAEGFFVLLAADGTEALEIAAVNPVDLVLLDVNMPGKSGWETYQRLMTDHPLLPVLIITGCPNQVFTALGAGVAGLLEKPLDFVRLRQSIKCLLAEPVDYRLARMTGRVTEFYYNTSASKKPE